MTIALPLRRSLVEVAGIMAPAQHDWWIIASAAVALYGADPGPVRDIDVLLDPRDGDAVLGPLGLEPRRGADDGRFRSDLFATWHGAPLPVELFAGFQLFERGAWQPVQLTTREAIAVGPARVFVPSREELHALLLRFGRDKDLARAALISPSGPFPSTPESV